MKQGVVSCQTCPSQIQPVSTPQPEASPSCAAWIAFLVASSKCFLEAKFCPLPSQTLFPLDVWVCHTDFSKLQNLSSTAASAPAAMASFHTQLLSAASQEARTGEARFQGLPREMRPGKKITHLVLGFAASEVLAANSIPSLFASPHF